METEDPNHAELDASEAVSFACWDQLVPLRTKIYAAPTKSPLAQSPIMA